MCGANTAASEEAAEAEAEAARLRHVKGAEMEGRRGWREVTMQPWRQLHNKYCNQCWRNTVAVASHHLIVCEWLQ